VLDKKKHHTVTHITEQENYNYVSSLGGFPITDEKLIQELKELNKRYYLGVFQPRKFELFMFDTLDDWEKSGSGKSLI